MVYTVIDCRPKQKETWEEIRRLRKNAKWAEAAAERKRWAAAWRLRVRALREQREREQRERKEREQRQQALLEHLHQLREQAAQQHECVAVLAAQLRDARGWFCKAVLDAALERIRDARQRRWYCATPARAW